MRIGYFAKPKLDGNPAVTLTLNGSAELDGPALDLEWDATRPTAVVARQALFSDTDQEGVSADTADSGLTALGDRSLAAFSGKPMTVLLAAPVDDGGELTLRAQACCARRGGSSAARARPISSAWALVLRAGMVVAIAGIGAVHSGRYLVWSVRHTITADAHTMKFTLVRNAVGNPPQRRGRARRRRSAGCERRGGVDDQTLIDVIDRLRNRFFGKYRGTVTEVDAGTMRIKAKVPSVLADQPIRLVQGLRPVCRPAVGMAFLPEIGSGVWIEFEGGDVSYPIWAGCYWQDGEAPPTPPRR